MAGVESRTWPASAAATWSLAYGALGLFWAFGGGGFPYGESEQAGIGVSLLTGFRADVAGGVITFLGLVGAGAALAMVRPWGRAVPRPVLLGFGWAAAATLLLVVPDIRALTFLGYLPALLFAIGFDPVDWPPILNQGFCLLGGVLWAAAALTYTRATGAATRSAPRDGPPWGRWVTSIAAALPLPYAATRLAWAMGISNAFLTELEASGVRVVEISLAGMAVVGALLTLGLVQRWGEVFPGWLPVLGGKRVPPSLAIVPATVASILVTIGGLAIWRVWLSGGTALGEEGWGAVTPALVFLPWGIMLGLATYAYAERRRSQAGGEPR